MTAARPALSVVPAEDLPAVDVITPDAPEPELILIVRGRAGGTVAWLDARCCRLLAASVRHVRDSRALGGLTVTIELSSEHAGACRAAGIAVSAGHRGLVLALLGHDARPLAAGRLDDAAISRLAGDQAE